MSPKTRRDFTPPFFLLSKPHFLLSRNDFSFLESNNQTLVALSLKLIFTPFWHSAPKGGRSSPPDFRFFWRKITPNFPFIASTFWHVLLPRDIIQLTLKFEDTSGTTQKKDSSCSYCLFLFSKKTQVNACRVCFECAELTNQQLLL